jgi:hypothetical protein
MKTAHLFTTFLVDTKSVIKKMILTTLAFVH